MSLLSLPELLKASALWHSAHPGCCHCSVLAVLDHQTSLHASTSLASHILARVSSCGLLRSTFHTMMLSGVTSRIAVAQLPLILSLQVSKEFVLSFLMELRGAMGG